MHIRSVTVKNYRIHRALSVNFDRKLTLIGGPNEVGKSTLAEAIHRGLFLKSKVTGETLNPMRSNIGDGFPEVEVEFQKHETTYRVYKKFAGANGTTRLSQVNGRTWQGDEAESRLAEILEVEQIGGGRGIGDRVGQQWAHLWVWQGQSGTDPTTYATAQRNALLAQLQSGSAVVMQSELDSKVAAMFMNIVTDQFSAKREPKAKSPIARTRQELSEATARVASAKQLCDQLQGDAERFRNAGKALQEADKRLELLKSELVVLNAQQSRANDLNREISNRTLQIDQLTEGINGLNIALQKIKEADANLERIQGQLQAASLKETELESAANRADEAYKTSVQLYTAAQNAAGQARARRELSLAMQNCFRVSTELLSCVESQKIVTKHRAELAESERQLMDLPGISEEQLNHLRSLSKKRGEACAKLNAIATEIELASADQTVLVGQTELQTNSPLVITELTEIRVGNNVRILVRPGGGEGVTIARRNLQEIDFQLQQELLSIAVPSLQEAEKIFKDRQELSMRAEEHKTALRLLNADRLPQKLEDLENDQRRYTKEIERRKQSLDQVLVIPETADAVQEFLNRCQTEEEEKNSEVERLRLERNSAEHIWKSAHDQMSTYKRKLASLQEEQISLRGTRDGLIQSGGNVEKQTSARDELKRRLDTLRKDVAELESELQGLEAGELAGKLKRLNRSLESQQEVKLENSKILAVSRSNLQNLGVMDPQEQLASANARLAEVEERLKVQERLGNARLLLNDLFHAEQQRHSAKFTLPLVTKIADYLKPVFGRTVDVELREDNLKFAGLSINRRDNSIGLLEFDQLSAGAREQLAAAMRLAMAELLAEGSDGCLPVVFDDAFAYSDPERVEALQSMLDLAANRGLQVIVLTCTPGDYYRLGASEVGLNPGYSSSDSARPAPQFSTPASASRPLQNHLREVQFSDTTPDTKDDADVENAVAESDENPVEPSTETGYSQTDVNFESDDPRAERVLEKLRQHGGTMAKTALRSELGLEPADFKNLLQAMLQAGLIREDRPKVKVSLANN